jgi:chromate transport protein ChrA
MGKVVMAIIVTIVSLFLIRGGLPTLGIILIVAFIVGSIFGKKKSGKTKKCQYCANDIKYEAIVCQYCSRQL